MYIYIYSVCVCVIEKKIQIIYFIITVFITILNSTTVFNIDNNKKCLLSAKLVY